MAKNRKITRAEIIKNTGLSVHKNTISNVLRESGYVARKIVHKPLLSKDHMKRRLEWAKKYKDWTEVDWEKVLFTDETKIELRPYIGGGRVWKKAGEGLIEVSIVGTVNMVAETGMYRQF